jgi:hypothetical protein
MSTRDLGITAIAVIGVWMLAEAVVSLAQLLALAATSSDTFNAIALAGVASYGAVGGLLIFLRYLIAKAWFPESVLAGDASSDAIASVLFAVLGVWFMARAATDLASSEALRISAGLTEYAVIPSFQVWPPRARAAAGFLIGFGLFAGSEGLAKTWRRLRQVRWYDRRDPPAA